MTLGPLLLRLRKEKGMTQEDLAGRVYVTRQAVSRWETGCTEPSIDSLRLLAEVMEVPVGLLVRAARSYGGHGEGAVHDCLEGELKPEAPDFPCRSCAVYAGCVAKGLQLQELEP